MAQKAPRGRNVNPVSRGVAHSDLFLDLADFGGPHSGAVRGCLLGLRQEGGDLDMGQARFGGFDSGRACRNRIDRHLFV